MLAKNKESNRQSNENDRGRNEANCDCENCECENCERENNVKISRESWFYLSVLAGCIVFAGCFLNATFKWMSRAQMTLMIAAPVADFTPVKRASLNYNGLLFPGSQEDENEVHLKSFDYVWTKIKESYWEKDFGGVDWDQARKELRPKVAKAENIKEVREILNQLISKMGKSHYAIIPHTAYRATVLTRRGSADAGLTFRYSNDKVLVSGVRSKSDAEKKGIVPGWEITKVGENNVADFLKKAKSYEGVVRLDSLIAMRFGNLTTGHANRSIECEFVLPDGKKETISIRLSDPPGRFVKFGNLPPMRISMEKKLLGSNVGYFRFNGFFDPVRLMPEFRKAVKEFQQADGMVIDIRGNGGGMVGLTMGMASPLTANPAPLGVMKMKNQELKLALFKTPKPYQKKIAVLVDEASASASEIYAGGLQDLKIAKVFGRRTAGLSLPSTVERLPNGDGFQYAIANYTSASGKILEGNGVVPDVAVELTPANLTDEFDPTLKRAVEWIQSESN